MLRTKARPLANKTGRLRRGRRVGAKIKTAVSRGKSVSRKFPNVKVSVLRSQLGFSQIELARVTGYSVRAIAGWESGKPLSDSARQKMTEAHRLREALAQIVPPDQVGTWMRTPNPAFEGQTPIQVMERGESDRLWRMIVQIDAGVAS